jgi:cytochrome oxidase Cu insertion factor (SCO1/SenC/PrrC family)
MSRRLFPTFSFGLLLLAIGACSHEKAPERESVDMDLVGDFALTERDGTTVRKGDLLGNVWVASFVFTRCTGPCPQVTTTMARLQSDLPADSDNIRLVTFTVDPDHDRPAELSRYAENFHADPKRWLFLTGSQADIYRLLREGFCVPVEQNTGDARQPGNEVMHSPRLVVVDRKGHVRGYFLGIVEADEDPDKAKQEFEQSYKRLREKVLALAREKP